MPTNELFSIFDKMDVDGDGTISSHEFVSALGSEEGGANLMMLS